MIDKKDVIISAHNATHGPHSLITFGPSGPVNVYEHAQSTVSP